MKRTWWIVALVFLLGFGIGCGVAKLGSPETKETMTETQPKPSEPPTQPNIEPAEGTVDSAGFPFRLAYTSLVAQKLIAYEGVYLEDGSEENVTDVAALILENTGTIGIEYAQIIVVQGGRELSFDATYIPPKSKILLLEENKQPYSAATVTDCRCRTVIPGVFDRSERTVFIRETGLGTLEVINLSEQTLENVRVFYKHHEGESDLYVGGITYSTVIPDLQPGQSKSVTPYRYASGYAQVVAVVPE